VKVRKFHCFIGDFSLKMLQTEIDLAGENEYQLTLAVNGIFLAGFPPRPKDAKGKHR